MVRDFQRLFNRHVVLAHKVKHTTATGKLSGCLLMEHDVVVLFRATCVRGYTGDDPGDPRDLAQLSQKTEENGAKGQDDFQFQVNLARAMRIKITYCKIPCIAIQFKMNVSTGSYVLS